MQCVCSPAAYRCRQWNHFNSSSFHPPHRLALVYLSLRFTPTYLSHLSHTQPLHTWMRAGMWGEWHNPPKKNPEKNRERKQGWREAGEVAGLVCSLPKSSPNEWPFRCAHKADARFVLYWGQGSLKALTEVETTDECKSVFTKKFKKRGRERFMHTKALCSKKKKKCFQEQLLIIISPFLCRSNVYRGTWGQQNRRNESATQK